jgi:hypothetical protein
MMIPGANGFALGVPVGTSGAPASRTIVSAWPWTRGAGALCNADARSASGRSSTGRSSLCRLRCIDRGDFR